MLESRREHGLPVYVKDQQAVLLGVLPNPSGRDDELAAYYIHWRGSALLGSYNENDGHFVPDLAIDNDGRTMGEAVEGLLETGETVNLSSVGDALVEAHELMEDGVASKKAHINALYDAGFTTLETAQLLNVDQNTVESELL